MVLTDAGELAIAEIVFWVPALAASLYICFRQGYRRMSAWFFISLLGIARLIHGPCLLVAESESVLNPDLYTAIAITGTMGGSFVISAGIGLQVRIFQSMLSEHIQRARWIKILYVIMFTGVAICIVAGLKVTQQPPDPAAMDLGFKLLKAAVVLFLFSYTVLCLLMAFTLTRVGLVAASQRNLVFAELVSLPIIFVRVLYSVLAAYAGSDLFSILAPNIWTEAFMTNTTEFLVGLIIIAAGFVTPTPEAAMAAAAPAKDIGGEA